MRVGYSRLCDVIGRALEAGPRAIRLGQGLTEIYFMRIGMLIWRTIVNFAKQVWLLPKNVSIAVEEKRRQDTGRVSEAERLDRIRNPSKYAGR